MIRDPKQVASLILLNHAHYMADKNRENLPYFAFRHNQLKDFIYYPGMVIPQDYIQKLKDELFSLGWLLIEIDHQTFGVLRRHSVRNWLTLSFKRVADVAPDTPCEEVNEMLFEATKQLEQRQQAS